MNKAPGRNQTFIFRTILTVTLVAVTWLATTPVDVPVVPGISDKINHLAAFAVLAFLADFSFPGSGFNLKKLLSLITYGILIEVIQYFLPSRCFSLLDIVADVLGLLLYITIYPLFSRVPYLSYLKAGRRSSRKG